MATLGSNTATSSLGDTDKMSLETAGGVTKSISGADLKAALGGGWAPGGTDIAVSDGGTGGSTLTGIVKGNGTSPFTAATEGADYYKPGGTDVAVADGGTGASTQAGARTGLGLGTMSTQDASAVAITGGTVAGITDLAVADGGTGSSTASAARTALGLVIGTNVFTQRTITGSNGITVTNGDGISAAPNIAITGAATTGVALDSDQALALHAPALTDMTNMSFSVLNTHHYTGKFAVEFRAQATGTGIQLALTGPTGTYGVSVRIQNAANGTAGTPLQSMSAGTGSGVVHTHATLFASATQILAIIEFNFSCTADGTLKLQFSNNLADSTITIKAGTMGFIRDQG